MTNSKMIKKEKLPEIEESEKANTAEAITSHDHAGNKDNQSVKLALAEELIEMGISKSSAHRILNIRHQ